jgi:hypothetical protein
MDDPVFKFGRNPASQQGAGTFALVVGRAAMLEEPVSFVCEALIPGCGARRQAAGSDVIAANAGAAAFDATNWAGLDGAFNPGSCLGERDSLSDATSQRSTPMRLPVSTLVASVSLPSSASCSALRAACGDDCAGRLWVAGRSGRSIARLVVGCCQVIGGGLPSALAASSRSHPHTAQACPNAERANSSAAA